RCCIRTLSHLEGTRSQVNLSGIILREVRGSLLKRLVKFLRSVLPADPTQLIFLAGVFCLFVAPHLRWWPPGLGVAPGRLADSLVQQMLLGVFFLLPISFAGVAGYFVCFWPSDHPFRRILLLVCLPAMAGLCLMYSRLLYLAAPSSSFAVQLTCVVHSRTSNNSLVTHTRLHSKRLVLQILVHHRDAGCFCGHILDCGKSRQTGDLEDDPAA